MQVSLAAEDIRNEKVKVLKCMKAMSMDDVVLGQYRARTLKGQHHPGYLDDKTVPPDRFCAAHALDRLIDLQPDHNAAQGAWQSTCDAGPAAFCQ